MLIDLFAGAGGNSIAFAASGRWERVVAVEQDAATLACAQRNARVYEVEEYVTFVLGDSFRYLDALRWAEGRNRRRTRKGSRMGRESQKRKRDGGNVRTAKGGEHDGGGGGGGGDDNDADCPYEIDESLLFPIIDAESSSPGSSSVIECSPIVFASPPWGGPGYATAEIFDLSLMEPYNLQTLHKACRGLLHALYLPRTSDLRQIAALLDGHANQEQTDREEGKGENNNPKKGDQRKNEPRTIEVVHYCIEGASKAMVAYVPAFGNALSSR